ncbi:MAG: hypothetical protein IJX46_01120 [Clostridia bacterium]|nr:hypothetical protein [Clostridia bacterium]
MLKKLFPVSFGTKDVTALVIRTIIYILLAIVAGAIVALATMLVGWIPVVGAIIGWALGVIGSILGLYFLAAIVVLFLAHFNVVK